MPDLDEHTSIKPVVLQGFSGVALRSYGGSLIMDKDGIVMIGLDKGKVNTIAANTTSSHEYGLYVAKGIRSESSRVDLQTAWPDFVFENSYNLTPLNELETYINHHHHLPNIPSAATVAEEGIDLGKMNANLLQKVEELTLYLIDLQKQVNELKEDK